MMNQNPVDFETGVFGANGDDNDFEYKQRMAEAGSDTDGGFVETVFDGALSGAARIEMYRAWVHPDLFPDERQPVLKNWSDDDLEFYCGIYNRKEIA